MEVHTISLLYFKQADTTKQPTAIQTVTMQPMRCNPNINTYLFNSTGLHEGWKKFTQLEYGNECRCAPSHSFIFKQAVTTKQPASMQIVSNCDNATHVAQPKHTHQSVQYYGFASRLEESHAVRIWELMQVRSISLPYFKQPIATKQPDSIQTETMQPMWCNPNISTYLFNTTGLHEGWEQNINKLLHTATFTQQIIEFIQSQWLLLWFTVSVCLGCALWSACTR